MSEQFPIKVPRSAQREFEMDTYEVRAVPFAYAPVEYLREFYASKLEDNSDEQEALFKLVDEFTSLVMAVTVTDIPIEDNDLKTFIDADSAYEQKKAFVSLMYEVGINREILKQWADIEVVDSDGLERLEERSYGVAIAEVYEKNSLHYKNTNQCRTSVMMSLYRLAESF